MVRAHDHARPVSIRPQGETHDPQRVHGPAATRNQVRSVMVRMDALPGGKIRLSVPAARGWARTVSTPHELNRAIGEAFTEAQVASYAAWHGEAYDRDAETPVYRDDPDPLVASAPRIDAQNRVGRSDIHDPRAWTPLPDGAMRSPAGRRFGPETDAVKRVRAKLDKLNRG